MASKTDICNMALSNLAVGNVISDFESERSQEAAACRAFYDVALEGPLRDSPWPSAKKTATLALIEEDPHTEWGYSYQYPSDCITVRRIVSGTRNETSATRLPYTIVHDAGHKLVY